MFPLQGRIHLSVVIYLWGWWGPILLGDIKLEEGWWWKKKQWIIRMLMNGWRHVLVSEQRQKIKQDYNYKATLAAPWGSNAHYTKENKTVGWKMEGQLYWKFVSYRRPELDITSQNNRVLEQNWAFKSPLCSGVEHQQIQTRCDWQSALSGTSASWGSPISNCRVWSFQSSSWMRLCWMLSWNR